jgi:hypothetical protein
VATLTLDESFVDSVAPNADAAKNGRGLVMKGAFLNLNIDADATLLFGKCKGSGKEPYQCSADFVQREKPVFRCNCPSRQFPCKHGLGLLYAYIQGKKFSESDVPEDISSKREKVEARQEKKKERDSQPRQVNVGALTKKIKAQIEGLDLLETLTNDLVRLGMGNMNAKTAKQIEDQAKQLGNAYLPGAQMALHAYTKLFTNQEGKFDGELTPNQREAIYSEALDQLTRLHTIVKQGREYLNKRLENPELPPDTDTAIAAWLGHAWQLRDLKEVGLVKANAEIVQLSFNSYDDVARQEYVDSGVWIDLQTGKVQLTQTYRPYKAAKFIKSEDSFFQVAQVPELCIYPGDVNNRIRWEGMIQRPIEAKDFQTIRNLAAKEFDGLLKEVKSKLKAPLADKRPIYVLKYAKVGKIDNEVVLEDAKGHRLVLTDVGMTEEPASTYLLGLLPPALLQNQVMVARFYHNLETRQLRIKPLSIVTDNQIIRLTF